MHSTRTAARRWRPRQDNGPRSIQFAKVVPSPTSGRPGYRGSPRSRCHRDRAAPWPGPPWLTRRSAAQAVVIGLQQRPPFCCRSTVSAAPAYATAATTVQRQPHGTHRGIGQSALAVTVETEVQCRPTSGTSSTICRYFSARIRLRTILNRRPRGGGSSPRRRTRGAAWPACRYRAAAPPSAGRYPWPGSSSSIACRSTVNVNAGERPCADGARRCGHPHAADLGSTTSPIPVWTISSIPATGSAPKRILSNSTAARSTVIRANCGAIATMASRTRSAMANSSWRRTARPAASAADRRRRTPTARPGVQHPLPDRRQTVRRVENSPGPSAVIAPPSRWR